MFEQADDSEVMETCNVNNIKSRVQTGVYKNFVCKTCGFCLSMEHKYSDKKDIEEGLPDKKK